MDGWPLEVRRWGSEWEGGRGCVISAGAYPHTMGKCRTAPYKAGAHLPQNGQALTRPVPDVAALSD